MNLVTAPLQTKVKPHGGAAILFLLLFLAIPFAIIKCLRLGIPEFVRVFTLSVVADLAVWGLWLLDIFSYPTAFYLSIPATVIPAIFCYWLAKKDPPKDT